MAAKPGRSKKLWMVVGVLATFVVVALSFLTHNYFLKASCEGIFQQTELNLASSIELLEVKGEIGFGSDKIQDLTENAQLMALELKTCCVAADKGLIPESKFLECKNSAGAFQSTLATAAQHVKEARDAKDGGDAVEASRSSAQAAAALSLSGRAVQEMPKITAGATEPAPLAAEREPNNDLFNGNSIALTSSVSGTLSSRTDEDVYKIQNTSKLRDWIKVVLENKSQKMAPEVEVYDGKRRSIAKRYESTRGANVEVHFVADAAEDFYVTVRNWSAGSGSYVLNVEPSKYYDEFEPNDAASEATPLALGRTVEATILDQKDSDWYRVNSAGVGPRKITLTNIKGKLKPEITLFNSNKSEFLNRYDSTEGANLAFTAKIPTDDFYIKVEPWSGGWGRYSLMVQ